jgi:hypothetical protein
MMKSEEITQSQGYHKVLQEREQGGKERNQTEREQFQDDMALGNTEIPKTKYDIIERDAYDGVLLKGV